MKVIITATGSEQNSHVDPRFGRAKFFVLADTQGDACSIHDNAQNLDAAQGAGIQAAQAVSRLGAEAVITGNVGPKAMRTLQAAGIKVYLCSGEETVTSALEAFKKGTLQETTGANVEGHW